MKLVALLISAVFVVSCSDDRNRDDLKNPCGEATLKLESYKTPKAIALSLPGKENKDNETVPAKNGKYILNRSTVHIHDTNLQGRVINGEKIFLQMSFGFLQAPQDENDIKENIQPFQATVNCLAGLKAGFAGQSIHQVNVPTEIEFSDEGSDIMLSGMKTFEMGFYEEGLMKVKATEDQNKGPTDDVDDINKTDSEPISIFYKNDEVGENYQLQSRVTSGNITITLISEYIRCVDPQEDKTTYDNLPDEEKKARDEAFEKCNTKSVRIKDLN